MSGQRNLTHVYTSHLPCMHTRTHTHTHTHSVFNHIMNHELNRLQVGECKAHWPVGGLFCCTVWHLWLFAISFLSGWYFEWMCPSLRSRDIIHSLNLILFTDPIQQGLCALFMNWCLKLLEISGSHLSFELKLIMASFEFIYWSTCWHRKDLWDLSTDVVWL